jgi:hypothetical protein
MSHYDYDDGVTELPEGRHLDPSERALAAAVQDAVSADTTWTSARLHALAEAADHRATQRRRQRLLRTPALVLTGAAAATALVLAAPDLLPQRVESTSGVAAPQDPAQEWDGATLAHLTPADVQAVLPGARPLGPGQDEGSAPPVRQNACGTAALSGVSAPVSARYGQWGTTERRQLGDDSVSSAQVTTQVFLDATVDTYATAAEADAYAVALGDSRYTCTPRSGRDAPTNPVVKELYIADVLYTSGYVDGRYELTAVVVVDRHASTVRAWVPDVDDQQSREAAAIAVGGLAVTAAHQAAAS